MVVLRPDYVAVPKSYAVCTVRKQLFEGKAALVGCVEPPPPAVVRGRSGRSLGLALAVARESGAALTLTGWGGAAYLAEYP